MFKENKQYKIFIKLYNEIKYFKYTIKFIIVSLFILIFGYIGEFLNFSDKTMIIIQIIYTFFVFMCTGCYILTIYEWRKR